MKENDKHPPFSILKYLCRLGFIIILLMVINSSAPATVSGPCSNCHTMHNSQDGSAMSTTADPMENLLVDSCVGCHSSTGTETIVDLNGSQIPIVYNTGAYPAKPLAGGNFYHVANDDAYGHNVWGISDQDAILDLPPGTTVTCGGGPTATSCHHSLAADPALNQSVFATGKNGCEGCHQHVKHHSLDPASGQPETAESGWFRGLGGHFGGGNALRVPGIEADDWEHTPSAANHNVYSGRDDDYERFTIDPKVPTITAYCVGCHQKIHNHWQDGMMNDPDSLWIRHSTDRLLPETGEYGDYNPVTNYNPTVPVGWTDITNPTRATAVVTCLSCHRAHGSQYPDMLRWNYADMVAGGSAATDSGCFVCHSTKDE